MERPETAAGAAARGGERMGGEPGRACPFAHVQSAAQVRRPGRLLAAVAARSPGSTDGRQPAGARGLMQLMPASAQGLDVDR